MLKEIAQKKLLLNIKFHEKFYLKFNYKFYLKFYYWLIQKIN